MLRNLIGIMDPVLYKRLEELNALHLFCAFRWILVLFRREFSVSDTQLLWDYLFADYYTPDMHIFIALAIMETQRTHILQDVGDGDDLLKYVNNLAGNIDLNLVLVESSELYLRFRRKAELDGYPDTKSVQEILEMYIK